MSVNEALCADALLEEARSPIRIPFCDWQDGAEYSKGRRRSRPSSWPLHCEGDADAMDQGVALVSLLCESFVSWGVATLRSVGSARGWCHRQGHLRITALLPHIPSVSNGKARPSHLRDYSGALSLRAQSRFHQSGHATEKLPFVMSADSDRANKMEHTN